MGMKLTAVTSTNDLVSIGLDSLPEGSVVEARDVDGGWRLYVKDLYNDPADGAARDWTVLATSRDRAIPGQGTRHGKYDRHVPTDEVATAAVGAVALSVLRPAEPIMADEPEGTRESWPVIVKDWSYENEGETREVALSDLVHRIEANLPARPVMDHERRRRAIRSIVHEWAVGASTHVPAAEQDRLLTLLLLEANL